MLLEFLGPLQVLGNLFADALLDALILLVCIDWIASANGRTLDGSHKVLEAVHVALQGLLVVALLVVFRRLFDNVNGLLHSSSSGEHMATQGWRTCRKLTSAMMLRVVAELPSVVASSAGWLGSIVLALRHQSNQILALRWHRS